MLPLFPLNLVVYPGDDLNLHIFEPRYRQLVNDCLDKDTTFGMPVHLDGRVQDVGTEVEVTELVKRHEDGKMDIRVSGRRVFQLREFANPMPDKLHAGGEVEWLAHSDNGGIVEKVALVKQVLELYQLLKVPNLPPSPDTPLLSYRVAHKIGMSVSQEYELLTILAESARLEYLADHLERAIPLLREMERTKDLIKLNGHFRSFDPLSF
jgi:Lon protease-like protein